MMDNIKAYKEWWNNNLAGRKIKEILSYNDISLWYFFDSSLFYRLRYPRKFKKGKIRQSLRKPYLLFKLGLRFILGYFCRLVYRDGDQQSILVISYPINWRESVNPKIKKKEDIMMGNIMSTLRKKKFDIIGVEEHKNLMNFRVYFGKLIQEKGLWRPLESYLDFRTIKKVFKTGEEINKKWKDLSNNKQFIELLKYNKHSLFNLLEPFFERIFDYTIFEVLFYIELMKRAIEVEKPKLILVTCEYCLIGRAAVISGKIKRIPTFAIQHGIVYPYHGGYFHTKEEISKELNSLRFPLPDKTAVYSPWVKKILTEICKYPPESVVITGQPRYDILSGADKIFSREKFCKENRLDSTKKIVLITTQPLLSYEERERFLKEVLKSLKKFSEIEIVIKPHPGENEGWHKNIIEREDLKTRIISKDSNILEALYACDVQLTVSSTTATEAIILKKPVIIVNFSDNPDPIPWVKDGVALGVYREKDLVSTIKNILYNPEIKNKLLINGEKFIKEHCYKIDGKATERIIKLAEKIINDSKTNEK